jgi:hypothetical protein
MAYADVLQAIALPEAFITIGGLSGHRSEDKFGRISDVSTTSDPEDVWNGQGIYTGQPENFIAETLTVVSSSAEDAVGSTGAHTLQLLGLDQNGLEISEIVTLTGLTPVTTTQAFWRCSRNTVLSAGSARVNIGEITVAASVTTANVFSVMPVRTNRTSICAFTIPAAYYGVIRYWTCSASRSQGGFAQFRLLTRKPGFLYEARDYADAQSGANSDHRELFGMLLPPLSDIKAQVFEVSTNNMAGTSRVDYVLIEKYIVEGY